MNLLEPMQAFLRDGILGFATAAWAFIRDSFAAGSMTPEWWMSIVGGTVVVRMDGQAATTIDHPGMLNVMVLALIPFLLIFVAVQVIWSLFRGSTAGVIRALTVAVASVPAVYVVAGLMFVVLGAVDQMSLWILQAGERGGQEAALGSILHLFGLTYDPNTGQVLMDENYAQWQMATNTENPGMAIVPFAVALCIAGACFLLMLMMVFRLAVIVLLTVMMPAAVFSLSLEPAKAVFSRWLSVVLALILAKPAAALVVKVGMVLASIGTDWIQLVTGVGLVVLGAAMPVLTITMISFLTGGASESMERSAVASGSHAMRQSTALARGGARKAGRLSRPVQSLARR
ncbi:hypothetical protein [Citricoccus sp. I39-566]|uniref:hypothetical protein n=1 Tax=Citricoccus sp. I39-566 TaxID=3073268 RepID=UPI00286C64A1|nr:hypothetical protein [Citricoccus sp. I39-566]WMY80042.1 hypothetical protein RE421_16640 [Citricoccus sp. I39-566]